MSIIGYNQVVAGYVKGTTFGTEADITAGGVNLYASSINPSGGWADFISRDFGQGGKRSNNARLAASFDLSMTFDLTYGQGWLGMVAAVMGTESTPSETTAGQTDYLTNIDVADSTTGLFYTVVYSIETDRTMVIPSFSPQSFSIAIDINGAGTVTVNGIADTVKESSTNTVAEVTALTDYAYETATLGGTNHYFRLKDYSTVTPLSSTHDKTIQGVTLTVNRAKQRRYGLRAANTQYTLEPLQLGLIDATLEVRHSELDNASYDILLDWTTPGFRMAELFIDGSQIGTGVNRSLKFQFPYLKVKGPMPGGHGVASNNGLFSPTSIVYDMLKTSAAPNGMTGVTDLLRIASIGPTRSAKWAT